MHNAEITALTQCWYRHLLLNYFKIWQKIIKIMLLLLTRQIQPNDVHWILQKTDECGYWWRPTGFSENSERRKPKSTRCSVKQTLGFSRGETERKGKSTPPQKSTLKECIKKNWERAGWSKLPKFFLNKLQLRCYKLISVTVIFPTMPKMNPVVMMIIRVAEILEIFRLLKTEGEKHFGKDA